MADRADAVRNRARLVEAAKRVFADPARPHGPEAVAREAGVGVGTLYRHFPTAEDLAAAVYEDDLARVADAAAELAAHLAPPDALRAWMDRFAERMAGKRAMIDALRSVLHGEGRVEQTRERLAAGVRIILDRGAADGSLLPDVDADDIVTALVGITVASPADPARAARLMDLLVRGVRAG
ncbi:TetR family transcriptional regulator [Pseudolysinimonas kribbensis]|uniref:TetR family transcriptional regulator n=1 Tax=Pseudolysinimonas kribbensis TaxID=433641 RepID=A0ABQ6K8T9_9MICO|nr:TetR/AcrR family transcriptional regulator [Pseudolysinimonas kribbensis]GMA96683.1 TetR family transcriptional regulator [Pseudolysinimonas kribbensis]